MAARTWTALSGHGPGGGGDGGGGGGDGDGDGGDGGGGGDEAGTAPALDVTGTVVEVAGGRVDSGGWDVRADMPESGGWSSAVPTSEPMIQMSKPTAPMVSTPATTRRRRYTPGGSGPVGPVMKAP